MSFTRRGFLAGLVGAGGIPEVQSVERLTMKSDDILIVKVKGIISYQQLNNLKYQIEAKLPAGTRILVCTDELDFSVIRKE